MKKIVGLICTIGILVLFLTGCSVKAIPKQESLENVEQYKQEIESIAEAADYEMFYESFEAGEEFYMLELWTIENAEREIIEIYINFEQDEAGKVVERVDVSYDINETEDFDFDLFVDVVNVFSGKKITEEICSELIEDPKDKYSWEQEDLEYMDLLIGRQKFLNFFEDWSLEYTVDKEQTETLSFWGLTEASTK